MENENKTDEQFWQEAEKSHKRGKVLGGFLLVIIGSLFLGRELGMEIPAWVFTWKTLLIGIGLVIGVKSNFRSWKWVILIAIGSAYLISDFNPELALRPILWPVLIIILGLMVIFKPKNKFGFRHRRHRRYYDRYAHRYYDKYSNAQPVNEDMIEATTVFGSVKKNIISKNFKGGEITTVLGGAEINLSQASFEGTVTLEITNVLGGTVLFVPANWEVHSQVDTVMGSVEDKRVIQNNIVADNNKILVIKGSVVMGGIEIKSF
jgi:predicted membrane protein